MSRRNPDQRWQRAPLPRSPHRFPVTAHRGDHTTYPENTVASLRAAIAANADFVEVDLRTTRDNHIVVVHDSTVDRTTDGQGPVRERTLAQIRALNIRGGGKSPRRDDLHVPTFTEMLRAARGRIGFYLDCKDVHPDEAAALVRRHKLLDRCVVYANPDECARWKRLVPEMPVMTSPPRDVRSPDELLAWLNQFPVEIVDGPLTWYTPERVQTIHAHGAVAWPDCMLPEETPALWDGARNLGVDGLQTDHPAALVRWRNKTIPRNR